MIMDVALFPYFAMVKYFSENYLQPIQPNQPVLLDNPGKKELELLIYEAGFREKNDGLPKTHFRQKKDFYELLIETNVFNPEWRRAAVPSKESSGTDLEETVHELIRYPHEFSYLSFNSENDQNKFLEIYSSMRLSEGSQLGIVYHDLAFAKRGTIRKLYRVGGLMAAVCELPTLPYISYYGFDNLGIVLAGAGLAIAIGAAVLFCAGEYVHRGRIADAEKELDRIQTGIGQLKFGIEQYQPITLLNKEALEKALEIK